MIRSRLCLCVHFGTLFDARWFCPPFLLPPIPFFGTCLSGLYCLVLTVVYSKYIDEKCRTWTLNSAIKQSYSIMLYMHWLIGMSVCVSTATTKDLKILTP